MTTSTKNAHLATTTESDPSWTAVVARDHQATFFFSALSGYYRWGVERKRALLKREAKA